MGTIKNFLKKCKDNPGNIVGLVGLVGLLLNRFGFGIDLNWLNDTVMVVCAILITVGVCNNPESSGIDLPFTNQKLFVPRSEKEK